MTTARRKPTKSTGSAKAAAGATKSTSAPKATAARKPRASAARVAPAAPSGTPAADVIVLTGPPSLLRATVSVRNAVDQRVAVRGLTLHRSGRQALAGSGAAVVAPGATADMPVSFRLEQDTPPGEYAAEVEIGGIRREALLRVEPDLSMHVSPRRALAEVGRHAVTLTVANDGNLAMPLAAVVRAHTDDGGPDPGPDVTLTLSAATTLAPGTTTVIQGHLTVPAELDPTRRHTARIPVGTADLDVIILPRDPSE
jgi:hypothetical protein